MAGEANGGANAEGGALDPETGVMYVTSNTNPILRALVHHPNSNMNFGNSLGAAEVSGMRGPQGLPLTKPPWGRITAIDLNTGEHLWVVPNGETPEEVKNHPALRGMDIPRTGKIVRGGTLVTKTLLFAGAGHQTYGDPVLQAFNKKTGQRIAVIDLPGVTTGVPMTYMLNGKQYIVVAVGGRDHPAELVALTLSDSTAP